MNAQRKNRGFTLIELVVVIAILAILAAFALPRFAQLSEQAHRASIQATAGALSASVALLKAQWVTNGNTAAVTDGVDGFGNDDVAATGDGWPDPENTGTGGCTVLWNALLQSNAPEVVGTGGTIEDSTEYRANWDGTSVCTYEYLPDGEGSEISYNADTGEVDVDFNP